MRPADIEPVSAMIIRVVRETNAKDYPPASIEQITADFAPARFAARCCSLRVFVALEDDRIVGTASLGLDRVHSVFVAPDRQGSGIGKALMNNIDELARREGRHEISLRSSFTAVLFYEHLGFTAFPDDDVAAKFGVVEMRKTLILASA